MILAAQATSRQTRAALSPLEAELASWRIRAVTGTTAIAKLGARRDDIMHRIAALKRELSAVSAAIAARTRQIEACCVEKALWSFSS